MTPIQVALSKPDVLSLKWDDGSMTEIPLRILRDNCPCASCQGETVLLKTYKPAQTPDLPGKYVLKGAQQVGSYALQVYWGDGHQTGIYTWETLHGLSNPGTV
jgi:DUF971 family protein